MENKIQTQYKWIYLPEFKHSVILFFTKDTKQLLLDFKKIYKEIGFSNIAGNQDMKIIKKVIQEENDKSWEGITISMVKNDISIILDNHANYGVLIHELEHAVQYICEALGIEDMETSAYMIEYLFEQSSKYIQSNKKLKVNLF